MEDFERRERDVDKFCSSDAVKSSNTGRVGQGYALFRLISPETLDFDEGFF